MAFPTKHKPPIDPFFTFCNARAFYVSTIILNQQKPHNLFQAPLLMCEIFALELHIKCLHHIHKRSPDGHNTKALFDSLVHGDRKKITRNYDSLLPEYKSHLPPHLAQLREI